jgi:hypothetical protein
MESTYLHFTSIQRVRRRQRGKGNVLYVRYADDFVVLCNGTKAEAHAIKSLSEKVTLWLRDVSP